MTKKVEIEVRSFSNFEIRQVGQGEDKETHIQGYALVFDSMSEDMGFREIISRGALDNCDMSSVTLDFNHLSDKILARNSKNMGPGSLILKVDDKGLFFDAIPTDTSYARDLITNMESSIVGKCSFNFNVDWLDDEAQTWDWASGDKDFDLRTIHKIKKISGISVVTAPAYESTTTAVYQRGKEEYLEESKKAKEVEVRKLEIELIETELSLG